jgi:hypothetical protein
MYKYKIIKLLFANILDFKTKEKPIFINTWME